MARRILGALLVSCLASSTVIAQGGGFVAGDLYLFNEYATGYGAGDGDIVRIDPFTGAAAVLVDLSASLHAHQGVIVFDPYRQRILFRGAVGPGQPLRLWMLDGAGNLSALAADPSEWHSAAATGDGRIYFYGSGPGSRVEYLDAAGRLHTLMDETGAAPWNGTGSYLSVHGLIFDAGTNALFEGDTDNAPCAGGVGLMTNVRKLPLSADGSQLAGPVQCAQFDVSPGGFEGATGWGRAPGGQLLLVVDTNTNNQEPRMLLVDPVTLSISIFASNGNTWAATTNGGTYSTARDQAVVFDTSDDVLRAFSLGGTGPGAVIAPSVPISASPGGGEQGTLIEIPDTGCAGGWVAYGTGLAGAGGLVPALVGGGCPEPGALLGLDVVDAVGGAFGVLLVGATPAAVPFHGGMLWVGGLFPPVNVVLGGAAGVPGAGSLSLPVPVPNDAAFSGVLLYLQGGFHDTAAVHAASLTQGLLLEIG